MAVGAGRRSSGRRVDGLRRLPGSFTFPQAQAAVASRPWRKRNPVGRTASQATVLVLVTLCLYVLLAPILPHLAFAAWHKAAAASPDTNGLPVLGEALRLADVAAATSPPIAGVNRLTADGIGVDGDIHEGEGEDTLEQGIWHRPQTSTPPQGGNTVLAAHRFKWLSGGNTFYNLDKIQIGNRIQVRWAGRLYTYQVFRSETVGSRSVEIEGASSEPMLTLYTCTPLWTSINRLVVQAKLVDVR